MKSLHIKKSLLAVFSLSALLISGCTSTKSTASSADTLAGYGADDIVILFTNDVHCSVDDYIGYAGLVDYRNKMLEETPYVTLVDCGDAVQGAAMGAVSKGEFIIEIMNQAGYTYAVLGNHEFDYGLEGTSKLMDEASFTYLGCNITYTGDGTNELEKLIPYEIAEYGDTKVAFIGVSTPYSMTSSLPKYFTDESGKIVYDFCKESPDEFYAVVQKYVDESRDKGADYVILLTHLGDTQEQSPFSSVDLINNTNGVDAVLDGHAHNKIPNAEILNKDGEDVILASTGTKLETIGQLVITDNALVVSTNVNPYSGLDEDMVQYIDKLKEEAGKELNEVVATSNTALSCNDEAGLRIVRNQETTIGDFCADAYRWASGADIGIVNGGGIRADLPSGNITYADILNVFPYGNTLSMTEATGQQIVDALEFSTRKTLKNYVQDGVSVGESGGFYQVSGLRFTVNTKISPSITTDEYDKFVSIDGPYRVTNVEVMDANGKYSPIDLNKTYTISSSGFVLNDGGDGCNIFVDNKYSIDGGMADYEMLISYIKEELKGDLSQYSSTDGRITIE